MNLKWAKFLLLGHSHLNKVNEGYKLKQIGISKLTFFGTVRQPPLQYKL